ncbi:MAG: NAD(P)/FAD-dependent oxidoreductase [Gammaproteobacteria bacterium]|nr:MAG: NAD(P)/FAD-dependent oxidoreductase [Gammaproteobacteria bacterium]
MTRAAPTLTDRLVESGPSDEPVTVVGAGVAGLVCAIVLARAGRPVIVREWRKTVGSRFHGDFQGLENWSDERDILDELRASGIEASFDSHPVYESTVFDAWGEAYPVHGERPLYYLIRRGGGDGTLDNGLLRQAIAAGADVRFGDRVTRIGGPAVLAIGPRVADAIAVGYVFETDGPDGSWAAFDNALAPLGYAYLLIHAGRGTLASCMFTGFKRQAKHVERTVAFFREKTGLEMRNPRPFGGYANFRLPRTAVQGGHLVVGEQAGFQDALAGFGMRYALRSGILAARSLIEGSDYTRAWRKELMPLLRTGASNRFIFSTVGERGRRFALRGLSRSDTAAKLLRLYRPSLLTRFVYPIARWRYRAALADPSCDHVACDCVWCRHGANHAETGLVSPIVPVEK